MRAAEGREVPGSLSFADRERAAVAARRLEHAERQRVDVRDRQRTGVVRRGREVRRRLEAAEEVRLLEDDRGGVRRPRARSSVGSVVPPRCGTSTTSRPNPAAYVFTTCRTCGFVASVTTILSPAGRVLRDVAGVGGDRRAVVAGRVRDVHARELADRRLVLEDRLQHALAHLRLVRRVRGQELAALQDRVDDRGDVVVVHAGAEERQLAARVGVPLGESGEVREDLLLRQRAARGRARGPKRTPPAGRGRAPRPSATPIVPSISSRSDVGEREERVRHWLVPAAARYGAGVEQRVDLGRDRRAGCGAASRRRTGPRSPSRARRPPAR